MTLLHVVENEYLNVRVEWCKEDVWPLLVAYWDSAEFKEKRSKAQDSCYGSENNAQNRGGSHPFTETQQYIVPRIWTVMEVVEQSPARKHKNAWDYQERVAAAHPNDPEQP